MTQPSTRASRTRGMSLLEIMIVAALTGVLILGASSALMTQGEITAQIENNDYTFNPATAACLKIRDQLKSAIQLGSGTGVTNAVAPAFGPGPDVGTAPNITVREFTWRPVIGYISPSDANYATFQGQGRVSNNNLLYADYAKRIRYDATNKCVKLEILAGAPGSVALVSRAGEPPGGVLVIVGWDPSVQGGKATGVTVEDGDFVFFDGDSFTNPPAKPLIGTITLGFRLKVTHKNVSGRGGRTVDSTYAGAGGLFYTTGQAGYTSGPTNVLYHASEVVLQPETLLNAKARPAVGP